MLIQFAKICLDQGQGGPKPLLVPKGEKGLLLLCTVVLLVLMRIRTMIMFGEFGLIYMYMLIQINDVSCTTSE